VLLVTGAQVPSTPPVLAALHASQSPLQAVLQQTPSTQFPDAHSWGNVQLAPAGRRVNDEPFSDDQRIDA